MRKSMKEDEIRKMVQEGYARIAKESSNCCSSCCSDDKDMAKKVSGNIGYSDDDLASAPEDANLGLGCGNPVAMASLKQGEIVLDLGSGAGLDCFIAAGKVGDAGKVIGVDMTPEMIERARDNAERGGFRNVEFRQGEIEKLPIDDGSIDVVISNCVINLSPDKEQVFKEAFRVLKKGGRVLISDIVFLEEIPEHIRPLFESPEAYVGCLAGAVTKEKYLGHISEAGFQDVEVIEKTPMIDKSWMSNPIASSVVERFHISDEEMNKIAGLIVSMKVSGFKR